MGRKQLTLLPDSQLDLIGKKSFEQIKKETPIEKNRKVNRLIRCISAKIIKATGETNINDWEVVVFKSPIVNAFALPGKKIGIYTGLISITRNDDEIASVIGHEVGHVLLNHGNERVSQKLLVQGGLVASSLTLLKKDSTKSRLLGAALGLGASIGYLLPYSRKHESEADSIGLKIMHRAGFRPSAAVSFWQRMANLSKSRPPEFLSTHPSPESRIKSLYIKSKELGAPFNSYSSACSSLR